MILPLADSKKSRARRNFNTSGWEAFRNFEVLITLPKPAVKTLEPAGTLLRLGLSPRFLKTTYPAKLNRN